MNTLCGSIQGVASLSYAANGSVGYYCSFVRAGGLVMGWHFDLRYTNTVAYVTLPNQPNPPRLTAFQLREFLGLMLGEYRQESALISRDRGWVEELKAQVHDALRLLAKLGFDDHKIFNSHGGQFLSAEIIARVLAELRRSLGNYELYGIPIGTRKDSGPLSAFAKHAAYSSGHHALFLIPDFPDAYGTLEIFDPLPVARKILSRPETWPGILFWLRTGQAVFVSLEKADGFYQSVLHALRDGTRRAGLLFDEFIRENPDPGTKRILHLSDFHFGKEDALQNQALLAAHLQTKLKQFDRVVITGDLFDNPKREDALSFRNFRSQLEAITKKEAIVVPGNHDQSIRGNRFLGLGKELNELIKVEWSNVVEDDELQCVFYCFDSSRDAQQFARGIVKVDQMIEIATRFETKLVAKPELRDYLSIAVIHHHPFAFNTEAKTPLQKNLKALKLDEESFVRMDEADKFLTWCAGRRVSLVLHGHKHVQWYHSEYIDWTHGKQSERRQVTAIGCGTSLGADSFPLSYNILEWSPSTGRWTASYFSDPGIGTGFEEVYVAQNLQPANG